MVRFDIDDAGEFAEVSINLNPDARGKGFGTATLIEGVRRFESDRPELRGTTALIRDTNAPSIAIFAKAGFTQVDTVDGVGHYLRESSSSES
jgi:L-amino acid N-acyltransferase YncA